MNHVVDNQVVIITHGFVDASALNHFKDEMELEWNHVDATSAMLPRPPVARKLEASEDMEDNTDDTEDTGGFGMSRAIQFGHKQRCRRCIRRSNLPVKEVIVYQIYLVVWTLWEKCDQM